MTQGTALLATGERNSNGVSTAAAGLGQLVDDLAALWERHGYQLVLGSMAVVAVVLAVALFQSWRRGHVDRWVSNVTVFAVLTLSAEGMWVVGRERLHLPVILAVAVFFVVEAAMVTSAIQARRHYVRTTVRDEAGRIIKAGNPGKHGRAVWVIATVGGAIVALNSHSFVEFPLRVALPLAAAYLWWNELTAEGTGEGERSSWRWTPRRFLLWLGAIEPGDRDMETINRDRVTASMTIAADQYHSGGGLAKRWHGVRLRRLARSADDDLVAEVARRVERVQRITELTDPAVMAARGKELETLRAAHDREVSELRAALEQRQASATADARRREEGFRAEVARLSQMATQRDHTAAARVSELEQQLEQLRRELRAVTDQRDSARGDADRWSGVAAQLRTAAREPRDGRQASGGAAVRRETAEVVSEPVAPRTPPSQPVVPEPVGSARSATALAVRADAEQDGNGADMSLRVRVFAVLDDVAPEEDVEPKTVTAAIVERLPECAEDTAARYYRKWRREVSEGKRQPGGRRLRVVPQRG